MHSDATHRPPPSSLQIDRNPRAKNREKYRRAVIKRKGQVRDAKAQEGAYGGESSGINQNVTHSRRFG